MYKETKMAGSEGFTLAELLIVVAIIAVLVAVSIPIFNQQLEKGRESTDLANMRAAKAATLAAAMADNPEGNYDQYIMYSYPAYYNDNITYRNYFEAYYDAQTGTLKANPTKIVPYGKGTATVGSEANTNAVDGYKTNEDYTGNILCVDYDEDIVFVEWVPSTSWTNPGGFNGTGYIENSEVFLTDELKNSATSFYGFNTYKDGTYYLDGGEGNRPIPITEQTIYKRSGSDKYMFYQDSTWYTWHEGTDEEQGHWEKDEFYTEHYGNI